MLLLIALNVVGFALKQVPNFPNWSIPLALVALGAIVYPLIAEAADVSYNVPYPVALNVVFGFCIGGGAVAMHQLARGVLERIAVRRNGTTALKKENGDKQ